MRGRIIQKRKYDSMEASPKTFEEAGMNRIIWDNAPNHPAKVLREASENLSRLHFLPPFCSELNPAERVFEEVRRHVEGKVWQTIEAKVATVEGYLTTFVKDDERVQSLVCWEWFGETFYCLPECTVENMASTWRVNIR